MPRSMRRLDELLHRVGAPVRVVDRVRQGRVVAHRGCRREIEGRHDFDGVHAHTRQVLELALGFFEGAHGLAELMVERADVQLVDDELVPARHLEVVLRSSRSCGRRRRELPLNETASRACGSCLKSGDGFARMRPRADPVVAKLELVERVRDDALDEDRPVRAPGGIPLERDLLPHEGLEVARVEEVTADFHAIGEGGPYPKATAPVLKHRPQTIVARTCRRLCHDHRALPVTCARALPAATSRGKPHSVYGGDLACRPPVHEQGGAGGDLSPAHLQPVARRDFPRGFGLARRLLFRWEMHLDPPADLKAHRFDPISLDGNMSKATETTAWSDLEQAFFASAPPDEAAHRQDRPPSTICWRSRPDTPPSRSGGNHRDRRRGHRVPDSVSACRPWSSRRANARIRIDAGAGQRTVI